MEVTKTQVKLQPYREEKGGLPFLVTWQSADGRPAQTYYASKREAIGQVRHLRELGRDPKIWLDVTEAPCEIGGEPPEGPLPGLLE